MDTSELLSDVGDSHSLVRLVCVCEGRIINTGETNVKIL